MHIGPEPFLARLHHFVRLIGLDVGHLHLVIDRAGGLSLKNSHKLFHQRQFRFV
jgi:hypothetical protein